jgi:hypothetical protein
MFISLYVYCWYFYLHVSASRAINTLKHSANRPAVKQGSQVFTELIYVIMYWKFLHRRIDKITFRLWFNMERPYVYYLSTMIEQYKILNIEAFRNWQV